MFEDFINALANFKRNKMRTFLSLLGIIIGVASVIVIMSMGTSSTKKIEATFGSNGLDMVSVSSGFFSRRGSNSGSRITFNETFREDLFKNVPGIERVWYKNTISGSISYGEDTASASITAIEAEYLEAYGLSLDKGNFFSITDDVMGAQKIILGSEVASSLFPNGDAIGKNITLVTSNVSFSFRVVGVLKEQSSGLEQTTTGCFVPRGFYSKKITPNPPASNVMVQAVDNDSTTKLVDAITNYCTNLAGNSNAVRVSSMQTMIDQMSSITSTISVMLAAIAAISLLVGGIGIMNIMIVTVTERKQEIGIRKALGATPGVIRQQFLVESASITVLGGIIGIILGIGISLAVEFVQSSAYVVSVESCIISFVFSVFVGIFFGLSPASRAAKLDPVVALSGE